jgi:hypothetical protein
MALSLQLPLRVDLDGQIVIPAISGTNRLAGAGGR